MSRNQERPADYPKLKDYKPTKFMLPTSHYDEHKGDRAVKFVESMCHTVGEWAGKPFWLLPWQEQIIRDIFGIVKEDGTRQFKTAFVEIPKKQGKLLALDTKIPTPNGFTSMGDLAVGDIVFDEKGNQCHVVAKSEVDDTEQAYRLTFRDGSSIVAGERHLWDCDYIYGKRKAVQWTTGEIYRRTQKYIERYKDDPIEKKSSIIRIPVCGRLKIEDTDLPIDPYLYGYWLGNGCSNEPWITVKDSDVEDIKNNISYELKNIYHQPGSKKLVYSELKKILVKNFREKKIRPEYLRASEEQRWALLQGLMDSDGCISASKGKAQSVYISSVEGLAKTVRELLWTLGIKNSMTTEPSMYRKKPTGEMLYVIRFTTFDNQPTSRLVRKAIRQKIRTKQTRSMFHYLKSIEPIDHPVQMQCIQVDSTSHCYLVGESFVPTHNSELAAAVALYLLYADNEPSAEVYGAACDSGQASIVFDVARMMVEMTPTLMKRSKIIGTRKRLLNYTNHGKYQVLSADVGNKHGLNISGLVFDEIHALPNRDLYDVLTKGTMDARRNPLAFIITTAGNNRNSVAFELHTKAMDLLSGKREDPTFYPVVYSLDMQKDWTDEKNWYSVNPSLGYTIQIDALRQWYQEALVSPADETTFRWLRLNQWVGSTAAWIPDNILAEGYKEIDEESLKGRKCYGGLDLSTSEDISAFALVFPPLHEDDKYILKVFGWVPEETVPKRTHRSGYPYDQWVAQGFLEATPGNIIDYDYILEKIEKLSFEYNLQEIAFDPYGAQGIVPKIEEMEITTVQFRQGFISMGSPTKDFYEKMLSGKIIYGENPVFRWMCGNVAVDIDAAGNKKVTKKRSKDKIDGVVAAIMALDRCEKQTDHGSIYDNPDHDLIVI